MRTTVSTLSFSDSPRKADSRTTMLPSLQRRWQDVSVDWIIARAGEACGFKATSHLLRVSFGCWLLARLEQLAKQGAAIKPLLIVKILMGHEHIETTDRYLRAVATDTHALSQVLDTLLAERH